MPTLSQIVPLNPEAEPFHDTEEASSQITTASINQGRPVNICSILVHFDGRFCLNPTGPTEAGIAYWPNNIALINNVNANTCGIMTIFGIAGKIREPYPDKIASKAWYLIPGEPLVSGIRVLARDRDVYDMFQAMKNAGQAWISVYLMNEHAASLPNPDGYPYSIPIQIPRVPPYFNALSLVQDYYRTTGDVFPLASSMRENMRRAEGLWYISYCNRSMIQYSMMMLVLPRSFRPPRIVPNTPPNSPS